jgi:hypothetical protein
LGEIQNQPFHLSFNASLKVDFQGSRVTSDGGLIPGWENPKNFDKAEADGCILILLLEAKKADPVEVDSTATGRQIGNPGCTPA